MIKTILSAYCVYCGKTCEYDELLCYECTCRLTSVQYRCANCGHALRINADYCASCSGKSIVNHYYADYIYNSEMKALIRAVKFNWQWRGVSHFGRLCVADGINFDDYDMGVPVPYHFYRNFSRFVQPVNLIAQALAKKGLNVKKGLIRKVDTQYQSKLTRRKRLANVKGVFASVNDVNGAKILLIDDLITTGATTIECAKTLKCAGAAKIDVYTLISGV